ncbi:MAG: flagellar biosynthesis anti-sigma factor FlgM [Pseudomonadales bacterium]|nr:flagellar biosynthesis anti-sigma factor FlgM [Pseudomonadales bacterium]
MAIEFNRPSTKNSTAIGTNRSSAAEPGKGVSARPGETAKASAGGDQVAISSHAQRIQSLEAKIQQMPEIDMAKVEAIKSSIEDGSYKIDAESTAQKMLAIETSIHPLSD